MKTGLHLSPLSYSCVIFNILGMLAYLLSEHALLSPTFDGDGIDNGFDFEYFWMTRVLSILILVVFVNIFFWFKSQSVPQQTKKGIPWAVWLIGLAWMATIAMRGTSIEGFRHFLGF